MVKAKYFKDREFKLCSPSCSLQDMQQHTMDRLDRARELAGIPFVLTSAYRSREWELKKGRTGKGAHTTGCAVDIRCNSDSTRMAIVSACLLAGFTRIGIGKTYIHVDDDENKTQQVMWHYYK